MKWLCTKINVMARKTGIGNMKLFIAVNTVICGVVGCIAALVLHMIPVLETMPLAELMVICGGYGACLIGMIGSAVYLLVKEPLSER